MIGQRQGDERLPREESFALHSGAEVVLQPLLSWGERGGQKLEVICSKLLSDSQRIHKQQSPTHSDSLVYAVLGAAKLIEVMIEIEDLLRR